MLEADGVLATWRVGAAPADVPPEGAPAERIGDHRLAYLSHEGEISGARGTVRRVEAGTYEGEVDGDVWRVALGARAFVIGRHTVTPA
jgi:hypothetical protein